MIKSAILLKSDSIIFKSPNTNKESSDFTINGELGIYKSGKSVSKEVKNSYYFSDFDDPVAYHRQPLPAQGNVTITTNQPESNIDLLMGNLDEHKIQGLNLTLYIYGRLYKNLRIQNNIIIARSRGTADIEVQLQEWTSISLPYDNWKNPQNAPTK